MDEEKRKKRNKKKKNKQVKPETTDGAFAVAGMASLDQNHVDEQNHHVEISKSTDVQFDAVLRTDADPETHHKNGTEGAGLETRIAQIQCEKDLWLQKEARLEEKISQLLDENATLGLKGANLEDEIKCLEKEKESCVLQENVTQDTVVGLRADNTKLRLQVMELEGSRNNLLQNNQQFMESLSSLQSQIRSLEVVKDASVNKELCSQIDAARVLIEKLVTENADLFEKVNELCIELDRRTVTAGFSSDIGPNAIVGTETSGVALSIPESSEITSASAEKMESLNVAPIKDESSDRNMDIEHGAKIQSSSGSGESGEISEIPESEEIVQIPLDENEVGDLESQDVESDGKAAVPLSDAPLIGAPFRLVSFFAKYVSGADLVNRGS